MKKSIAVALGALLLASAGAYAQMQHHGPPPGMPGPSGQPMMGPGMMQGQMPGPQGQMPRMQGQMPPGQMPGMQGMMPGMHGQMSGMHGPPPGAPAKGDQSPSSLAFHAINAKMHDGMNITFSGNADVDFIKGMIPHHQGAIDMAKTVIAFGKDPEVKKLAEEIIKAQESEIALMQAWLKKAGQ